MQWKGLSEGTRGSENRLTPCSPFFHQEDLLSETFETELCVDASHR